MADRITRILLEIHGLAGDDYTPPDEDDKSEFFRLCREEYTRYEKHLVAFDGETFIKPELTDKGREYLKRDS